MTPTVPIRIVCEHCKGSGLSRKMVRGSFPCPRCKGERTVVAAVNVLDLENARQTRRARPPARPPRPVIPAMPGPTATVGELEAWQKHKRDAVARYRSDKRAVQDCKEPVQTDEDGHALTACQGHLDANRDRRKAHP